MIAFFAKIKLRILQKKGLTVVAIAGSYGKTSTKHILDHILNKQITTLVTPKSVNTPLGISQIIFKKLKSSHQLFIVELGEYYLGDIKNLANFIRPDWGVLTPIGSQHLERMGSLDKIAATMGELLNYFAKNKNKVLISDQNSNFYGKQWTYYGHKKQNSYRVQKANVDRHGTEFTTKTPHLEEKTFSPLYGQHQAENVLPALWLSRQLNLDVKKAIKSISTLRYLSRRHEPTFAKNQVLVLDNSYNTNPESIKVSLELINQLPASTRIVITLGFVELGSQSDKQHLVLGKLLAKKADYVGLVKSRWNEQVKVGFIEKKGKKSHFITASNPDQALSLLHDKIQPNSIILLEGGYQEIFT